VTATPAAATAVCDEGHGILAVQRLDDVTDRAHEKYGALRFTPACGEAGVHRVTMCLEGTGTGGLGGQPPTPRCVSIRVPSRCRSASRAC